MSVCVVFCDCVDREFSLQCNSNVTQKKSRLQPAKVKMHKTQFVWMFYIFTGKHVLRFKMLIRIILLLYLNVQTYFNTWLKYVGGH